MQDRIGFVAILLQRSNRLSCRKDKQFNFAALSFELHVFHYRQASVRSGADDQPPALLTVSLPQRTRVCAQTPRETSWMAFS